LSLFKSFGRQPNCGEQPCHYLNHRIAQGSRMGNLRIDSEMAKKTFDRLEQVDKRTIARIDAFGSLI
jgi:hypothetical protein